MCRWSKSFCNTAHKRSALLVNHSWFFFIFLLLLINLSLTWKCSFVLRATNQLLPAWNNYKMYFLYFFLYLASGSMQSFVLHFPPLHVQTWIWSKSSHRFAKLFFLFRHFNLFYASPSSKISIQLSFWWLFEYVSNYGMYLPYFSHQRAHLAPTNQRGPRGAWAPACHVLTCSTPPSLAAPPSVTAFASRAISQ